MLTDKDLIKNETTPVSIVKLLKKINQLLNEISSLRSRNKDLEKINKANEAFLREIPARSPLFKRAQVLINEESDKLDRADKKRSTPN